MASYYDNTGRIMLTYDGPIPEKQGNGLPFVQGTYQGNLYYVDVLDGKVKDKPENTATIDKKSILANGVDTCTISNIPNPSIITINGIEKYEGVVINGQFIFNSEIKGIHRIKVDSFPFMDKVFTIYVI